MHKLPAQLVRNLAPAIVAVLFFAALFAWVYQTRHNVKEATHFADAIRPQVQADPRFALVQCGGGGTINDGCLRVVGSVASEHDFAALQALVASTHPPVPPRYQVRIETPAPIIQPSCLTTRSSEQRPAF